MRRAVAALAAAGLALMAWPLLQLAAAEHRTASTQRELLGELASEPPAPVTGAGGSVS